MSLKGKNILLGICGGIAAYKVPGLIRILSREGASVQVILTKNGGEFVGKATLSTLTRKEVITDLFPENQAITTEHISASDWAHALLVTPATANCLAKFARGIADDFLSTLYLSLKVPVILAPSMNERMWAHPATQENAAILRKRGAVIIEPAEGDLACGTRGKGRLPAEEVILFAVRKALTPQDLAGKKILVTCGGTEEALDPVRVITNKSSGRMGIALAKNAMERGADVTLIHGHVTVQVPSYIRAVKAQSVKEMLSAVENHFRKSDLLIMAAAVSDFTADAVSTGKIKKSGKGLLLKLKETPDILKTVAKSKGKRKIIGFSLEDEGGEEKALRKLREKQCDLMIYNTHTALGSDKNEITIIKKSGAAEHPGELSKEEAAKIILDHAAAL